MAHFFLFKAIHGPLLDLVYYQWNLNIQKSLCVAPNVKGLRFIYVVFGMKLFNYTVHIQSFLR